MDTVEQKPETIRPPVSARPEAESAPTATARGTPRSVSSATTCVSVPLIAMGAPKNANVIAQKRQSFSTASLQE